MVHAAETWAMTAATMRCMRRNDRAMIRWNCNCNVRAKDEVSSDSHLSKLRIQLDVVLRTSRMRWFGHVERSTGWITKVCKLNEPRREKIGFLHMRKQRRRSALRWPRSWSAPLFFATWIVQSLCFPNPKFQVSSHLLWLYSPVCVEPCRKPRRPVFLRCGSSASEWEKEAWNGFC